MSRTLTISENLYTRLQVTARTRGVNDIEELIEQLVGLLQTQSDQVRQRSESVRRIDALRTRLYSIYGEMRDSVELIRADRER
jgi:t-SNARE complex subunit (syntaxin)